MIRNLFFHTLLLNENLPLLLEKFYLVVFKKKETRAINYRLEWSEWFGPLPSFSINPKTVLSA